MSFLKRIINQQNKNIINVDLLANSDYPLFIYGAGSYSNDIITFLEKNNIKIDAVFVDDFYVKTAKECVESKYDIFTIDQLRKNYIKFNVVIGVGDFKVAINKFKNDKQIENLLFFDSPFYDNSMEYSYILNNIEKFEFTYDLLEDDESKDILVSFLNAKISGEPGNLYDLYNPNSYFVDVLKFNSEEIFLDCGAYDGDTVLEFVKRMNNQYRKIYALEIDESTYPKLLKTIKDNNIVNIQALKIGSWHQKDTLFYKSDTIRTKLTGEQGDLKIEVDTIDSIVGDDAITYIKMDIEGAELMSLKGAEKTIVNYKPKLAICVYHKPEDLITIPQYINSLRSDYKFYLRHHRPISTDTVLYAI
jgi:FkbM family methyltransferase